MARQVLPIVGAIVGAFIPGVGPALGYAIGSVVGNAVDPVQIQGPKIGDVAQQTSSEGVYQPIYFGTAAGAGNIIAQGPNIIKKKKDSGKGGPETTTEYLYKTFAIRIGKGWKGAITGVSRIWEDGKLVYDIRAESTIVAESIEFAKGFRLYLGTQDQLPDPDLEAIYGIGNTPAYVGRAYIVFPRKNITDRKSIPDYRFEVVASGSITPPVETGKWIFGPVTQNGSEGGPQTYYRTTDDLTDWASGTLHPLPDWLSSLGRISTANGKAWLQSAVTENAAFSSDKGVTWTECDSILPDGHDVTWNGDYFYCKGLRSVNGINWEGIPGLSGTPVETLARDSDGMVLCAFLGGDTAARVETTLDNGSSWAVIPFAGNVSYFATDGSQTQFTYDSSNGVRTYDFVTFDGVYGDTAYSPYYGDGIWLRKGLSSLLRSTDGGANFTFNRVAYFGASDNKTVAYSSDQHLWAIANLTTGIPDKWDINYSYDGGATWDVGGALYGNGGNIVFIGGGVAPGEVTSDSVPLDDAVATIHGLAYQAASKYDVTDLEGTALRGLVLAGAYTAADSIRTLAGCEFFDSPEMDKKIIHSRRGKPVVAVITEEDLVADSETSTREQAIEYPKKLNLDYQSEEADYAPAKATSARSSRDARVIGEANVQVPINMGADLAAQKAVILHKVAWADADGEVVITVPDRFLFLVPGDCIGLNLRGRVTRLRIDKMEYSPGTIKLTCRNDRQSAYTSNVTGIPVTPPTPPAPSIVGPTLLVVGDWPALIDTQDRLGLTYAVTGQTEAWHGAQVDRSTDGGANFAEADQFSTNSIMGLLLDDVTAASAYFTDTTNVLRVRLYMDDELESLTDAQFNSEGGAFALGTPDGWEICQYRDAEQDSNGDWLLTYLKRGQLNTDAIAHEAGATFVLLDSGVHFVDTVTAWLNTDLTHRAVSYGRSPDGVPTQAGEYTGASQREFPVASVSLSRNVNDITVSIIPRHRFGTESNPIRSINWERYTIEINDGSSVSVLGTTSDTLTFDASALSSPITISVAQRNRLTGDGPAVSESIA